MHDLLDLVRVPLRVQAAGRHHLGVPLQRAQQRRRRRRAAALRRRARRRLRVGRDWGDIMFLIPFFFYS